MAVRSTAYIVFLFPVVASLFFGTMVLGEVLREPERNLDLWPFESSGGVIIQTGAMTINGLQESYSVSKQIEITVSVSDSIFDCGDLYITIYDISKTPHEVITQNGFFGQCYSAGNLVMPIDDKFSESIDVPGKYEIVAEINDKEFKKTLTTSKQFTVK